MNSMYGKSLVVLTPLKQSSNHNIARIHREYEVIDSDNVLHVGAGSHVGIVVNKLMPANIEDFESDVSLSFSVWLTNRKKDGNDQIEQVQEKRSLLFKLGADIELDHGRAVVHKFFKTLMSSFPTDYVSFMKKTMKLLQQDFPDISSIIIDYKIVEKHEQISIPDAAQYESESEVEEVTIGHVQEVLEHAYPNGLNLRFIAEALRCKEEEASAYLAELEEAGIATYLAESDEWLRNTSKSQPTTRNGIDHDQPTVAIITCLFVEKQAMDSLIEDSTSIHKYKTGGESNVYTLGRIGNHKVVATKLGLIGDSREAITSAGSITTRLLGNFQQIEHVFVVGVGGAVPHYTDERLHARLGDAVISASNPHAYVYAHELMFNRDTNVLTGFGIRNWDAPDKSIQNIVSDGGEELRKEWGKMTNEAIRRLQSSAPDVDWSSPPESSDVLAMPVSKGNVVVMPHPNANRAGPEFHMGTVGALTSLKKYAATENDEDTITQIRESFAESFHVRSIDVGFDSVVASIVGSCIRSWALVRGVADYQHGQSRAGKLWQAYAAARAAAMTRSIIERLPPPS